MNLIEQSKQKVDYTFTVIDGVKVYSFKTIGVNLSDENGNEIRYNITRSTSTQISHYIERNKRFGTFWNHSSKIYDNDKSFENAIKRIEKLKQISDAKL